MIVSRISRGAARILRCLAALALLGAGPAMAQQGFAGTYQGLDDAAGLTLSLRESGGGVSGRMAASDGSGQDLSGTAGNGEFSSPLTYQGQRGTAVFRLKPIGIAMVWRPGNAGAAPERVFAFKRRELGLPRLPPGYEQPPAPGYEDGDALAFLRSYEFWPPEAAARAFDAIDPAERTLIRVFPAVLTDVLWKLCQSGANFRELGAALRGASITCDEIDDRLKVAQASGGFDRFKTRVAREKQDALRAVECARGIHTADICTAAAAQTQRAATALETVSTVLRGL